MRLLQTAWWRLRRYARWLLVSLGVLTPKTVVLIGLAAPYRGEKGPKTEFWGINRAYIHQKNLDRLYFVDDLQNLLTYGAETFVEDVNALGVPVWTKRRYEQIPLSRPLPILDLIRFFGVENFTSSISLQIAHALYEGVDRLVVNMFYVMPWSREYFAQKACIDYWLGVAAGVGVKVVLSQESSLCLPYPWEPRIYGYVQQDTGDAIDKMLARAASQVMDMPWTFRWPKDLPEGFGEPGAVISAKPARRAPNADEIQKFQADAA